MINQCSNVIYHVSGSGITTEQQKKTWLIIWYFANAFIFDNSDTKHDLIADKQIGSSLNIINFEKFNRLKIYYDKN